VCSVVARGSHCLPMWTPMIHSEQILHCIMSYRRNPFQL
jgi:hypothetical protein